MLPSDDAPPSPPTSVRVHRSGWDKAAIALLGLAIWVGYRTERTIFRDTRSVTVITNVRTVAERAEARRHRDVRDDIAEIYGVPVGSPIDVISPENPARARWLVPIEDPNRRLVPLADLAQFRTPSATRLVGHGSALGMAATGLAAYTIGRRRRRRRKRMSANADGVHVMPPSPPE